jgi:DNA polymerase III epsilon subunit-like protein
MAEKGLDSIRDNSNEIFLMYEQLTSLLIELGYKHIQEHGAEEDLVSLVDLTLEAIEGFENLGVEGSFNELKEKGGEIKQQLNIKSKNRSNAIDGYLRKNQTFTNQMNSVKKVEKQTEVDLQDFYKQMMRKVEDRSDQPAVELPSHDTKTSKQHHRQSIDETRQKLKQTLAASLYKRIHPLVTTENLHLTL